MKRDMRKYNELDIAHLNAKTSIKVAKITGIFAIGVAIIGMFSFSINVNIENTKLKKDCEKVESENFELATENSATKENYNNLKNQYLEIEKENETLQNTISDIENELSKMNSIIKENSNLKVELESTPIIDYKNLALCIDVDDIPINTSKSVATIDGRDYFSKEIVEKLITENRNLTIKDETIYIGQVVAEKANLLDMNVMDSSGVEFMTTVKDSYNKNRSNAICITTGNSVTKHIIFTLDNKYSLLKLSIGIRDNAKITSTGVLVIKADNDVVYTSDTLNKETEPYTTREIPINNCNRLTIEYTPNPYSIDCIIYNAIVYN